MSERGVSLCCTMHSEMELPPQRVGSDLGKEVSWTSEQALGACQGSHAGVGGKI